MEIHLVHEDQRLGPLSLTETNRLLARSEVALSDLAWHEGVDTWIKLGEIPGVDLSQPLPVTPASAAATEAYAGFWIRSVAFIVDMIALTAVSFLLHFALRFLTPTLLRLLLRFLVATAYFALSWTSPWQATLGQKLCRLRVVHASDGRPLSYLRSAERALGLALSFLSLCVGFIMIAFSARKQGLHDRLAGTFVLARL